MKKFILITFLVVSNTFASIESSNCKPIPLFECESLGMEAKSYYDALGEWSGVYTMNPVRIVEARLGVCHIKYFYTPAKGSYAKDTGYDFRIFYFSLDNKTCKWKATKMDIYMSGYLAYD